MYDSLRHQTVNASIKNQIANNEITLHYFDVQGPSGSYDCGLFALAFATAIVNNCDPTALKFNQVQMRQHFFKCFKEGLSMFPTFSPSRRSHGIFSSETIELFCTCRMPDIPPMVQCSGCSVWYHTECVNVPKPALEDEKVPWYCSSACI